MIKVSAPAKIHLLGEHSVTYGKPALLTAINLRLTLTLKPGAGPEIKEIKNAQKAIETEIKKRYKKTIPKYSIQIDSQIPIGSGNGSSAAISSCLTAALLEFVKINWNKETLLEIAISSENVFHGKSSGGDLAAVTWGQLIWFRKEFDTLRIVKPINEPIKPNLQEFVLINSGKPKETTKHMVELVAKKYKTNKKQIARILDSQEELTKQMAQNLIAGKSDQLMQTIKNGEKNLELLGVVGKKSRAIIKSVEKAGGAAKILGGGGIKEGSGMILCYHKNLKKILTLAQNNLWEAFKIQINQPGLRIEK